MNVSLIVVSVSFLSLALLAVLLGFVVKKWAFPLSKAVLEGWWSERWDTLQARLEELERHVDTLPQLWEEFAVDARKRQERARWHVRRVKKELEKNGLSDPEIDSLDSDLRPLDGEGSEDGGLSPLSDHVAQTPSATAEDPITAALRRKWGSQ